MLILALDSSGSACSAALIKDDRAAASRFAEMARGQSEALIPMVAEVLAQSGRSAADLDAVAVCVGPGAFTGIRIGLAAARGLGLAAGKPVLGIAAPDVVAAAAAPLRRDGARIMAVIDSRRAELWVQIFDCNLVAEGPIQALNPDQAAGLLDEGMVVAGDGAHLIPGAVHVVQSPVNAVDLGRLAAIMHAEGRALPPEPLYLRDADITMGRT